MTRLYFIELEEVTREGKIILLYFWSSEVSVELSLVHCYVYDYWGSSTSSDMCLLAWTPRRRQEVTRRGRLTEESRHLVVVHRQCSHPGQGVRRDLGAEPTDVDS